MGGGRWAVSRAAAVLLILWKKEQSINKREEEKNITVEEVETEETVLQDSKSSFEEVKLVPLFCFSIYLGTKPFSGY